ncbi:MAG: hypothetical protein AAF388_27510, partial [Bacteroidota bacterium]
RTNRADEYIGFFTISEFVRYISLSFVRKSNFKSELFASVNYINQIRLGGSNDLFFTGNIQYLGQSGDYINSKCIIQKVNVEVDTELNFLDDISSEFHIPPSIRSYLTNNSSR